MFRHSLRAYYLMGGLIALFLAITAAAGLVIQDIYQPLMKNLCALHRSTALKC